MGRYSYWMFHFPNGVIIGALQTELSSFDLKLQALWTTAGHQRGAAVFNKKAAELNEHLEKFNRDVILSKEKKLIRDKKAFVSGRAYKWFQSENQRPQRNHGNINQQQTALDGNISDSSVSSISSFSSQTRRGQKQSRSSSAPDNVENNKQKRSE